MDFRYACTTFRHFRKFIEEFLFKGLPDAKMRHIHYCSNQYLHVETENFFCKHHPKTNVNIGFAPKRTHVEQAENVEHYWLQCKNCEWAKTNQCI